MIASRFFGKRKVRKGETAAASSSADPVPRHVAIIMDGNNRWARQNLSPGMSGHSVGAESIRNVLRVCQKRKVDVLTLFAFSSENWSRPASEVQELMALLRRYLGNETEELHKEGVRLKFIGRRDRLDADIVAKMQEAEALTADNSTSTLVLALDYGGCWDISQAANRLVQDALRGEVDPSAIDEKLFAGYMSLAGLPAPDLCIRTGAEQRISNFLLWDLAYAELYFTDCYWPDFDEGEFELALAEYARRQRRFGQTSNQAETVSTQTGLNS